MLSKGVADRKWWSLVAVSSGFFLTVMANTAMNVAYPEVLKTLDLRLSDLEWVVSAYLLTFSVLIPVGGRLADFLGRKRIFVLGMCTFAVASVAGGFADSAALLIAARIGQGIGAALVIPASLSIITATFSAQERGVAFGIFSSIAVVGLAVGPLLGGLIVEYADWEWIFFVSALAAVLGATAATAFVTESRDTSTEQRFDIPGLITASLALLAISLALIETNNHAFTSPGIIALLLIGALSIAAFIWVEKRQSQPMLDLSLFRGRNFAGANTVMFLLGLVLVSGVFFLNLFLQNILDYSPIENGLALLPGAIVMASAGPMVGRLTDRYGSRWLMVCGPTMTGVAFLLLASINSGTSFEVVALCFALYGVGLVVTTTPTTTLAMNSVPLDKAGVGSAVLNSLRYMGSALGIAVGGAIVASQVRVGPDSPFYEAQFLEGFRLVAYAAAGIAALAGLVALLTVRKEAHPVAGAEQTVPLEAG